MSGPLPARRPPHDAPPPPGLDADVDLDLDQPPPVVVTAPAARGRPGSSRWWFLGAGLLAGLVVGHAWQGPAPAAPEPAPAASAAPTAEAGPRLTMALGAFGSGVDPRPQAGKAVVHLNAVVVNEGQRSLTLVGVRVSGPGAGLLPYAGIGPGLELPKVLPVGESTDVPLTLSSTCAVPVRPIPLITLVVRDGDGPARPVAVHVPDLERLWGATLNDQVCPAPAPGPSHSYAP